MKEFRPPPGTLPGEWEPPAFELGPERAVRPRQVHEFAYVAPRALSAAACAQLSEAMRLSGCAAPVSVSGHPSVATELGSVRATAWAPQLASELWRCLKHVIPPERRMTPTTPTDWYALDGRLAHRHWRAVGIGPVLRFMRYEAGGRHYAHYDMGFDYPDARRTLMSLVVYLSEAAPGDGGCTRIVQDGQQALPVWRRNHEDWTRDVADEEVVAAIRPQLGDVLIFDHRLCHDVEPYRGQSSRVIIRGDVVFEALDPGETSQ